MLALRIVAGAAALGLALAGGSAHALEFSVTNLVSDTLPAVTTDSALVNPWGVAASPTGPFWVSDNGAGVSTLYNGAGAKLGLTVTIPVSPAAPTGIVFNGAVASGAFPVSGTTPLFIFDTEDGIIAGWAPAFGTNAAIAVNDSAEGAIYKGLAINSAGANSVLYAADFHNGSIDAYSATFTDAPLAGTFTDPTLPAGFAPFNVQVLNGELFVAFAMQDADKADEVAGAGLGFVDVFNLDGTFNRRIASQGDAVNAPWGLAIAPDSFGALAGSLLVGNFGDGSISAFNPLTGTFLGKLRGTDGKPLFIDGLWALLPGNDGAAGDSDKIYFSAGIDGEHHGLFGSLTAVPEPAAWISMILGFGLAGSMLRLRGRALRLA